jgi:hypothetical protein
LEGFGGGDQFRVRVLTSGAAEDGDFFAGVEDGSCFTQLFIVGADERLGDPDGRQVLYVRRAVEEDVARQDDDGHPGEVDGSADDDIEHAPAAGHESPPSSHSHRS